LKSVSGTILAATAILVPCIILCLFSCQIQKKTSQDQQQQCPPKNAENQYRARIVFYNTENCFDTLDDTLTADEDFLPDGLLHWTYSRYKTKLEKMCKVIVAAGEWAPPDLIGLAEIENSRVLYDLINRTALLKYEYRFVHKDSPDLRGIDVALLYNPATIRILETTFIKGSFDNADEKPTRDILCCKVSFLQREIIYVVVNHWPSRSSGILETEPSRLSTAKILRMKIDSVFQTGLHHKIIIMGDFNDGPYDKSLIQGLQAQTNTDSPLPGILYNLSAGYEQKNKVGSHKYQGQWSMLDQVIVSGELLNTKKGLRSNPACFSVFAPAFLLTEDKNYSGLEPFRTYKGPVYVGGFSDHLPVVVDLY
jgi:predicted extracellular nuclease